MWIQLLTKYWKPIALTALALIIFSFGWYKGNAYQKSKFDAFLKEQELLAMQQQAQNELIKQNQDKILLNSANAYNETIEKVKNYYEKNRANNGANNSANRMLNNASGQSVSAIQKPTELSAEVRGNQDSASLEQDCAITTAQYNALHDAWDDLCKVSACE